MDQALQQIRFQLDEQGAFLKVEAKVFVLGRTTKLEFNHPFLRILKYKEAKTS